MIGTAGEAAGLLEAVAWCELSEREAEPQQQLALSCTKYLVGGISHRHLDHGTWSTPFKHL